MGKMETKEEKKKKKRTKEKELEIPYRQLSLALSSTLSLFLMRNMFNSNSILMEWQTLRLFFNYLHVRSSYFLIFFFILNSNKYVCVIVYVLCVKNVRNPSAGQ